MEVEELYRKTTIVIRDESYWKIKMYMAKLGIRKWITFFDVIAKILEDVLENEENVKKYKAYVKQLSNSNDYKVIVEEEETTGLTTSTTAGANHDNK